MNDYINNLIDLISNDIRNVASAKTLENLKALKDAISVLDAENQILLARISRLEDNLFKKE